MTEMMQIDSPPATSARPKPSPLGRARLKSFASLSREEAGHNDRLVEISQFKLRQILLPILELVPVDEKWYLTVYSDVAEAVKLKQLDSARHHYIASGFFEDRFPYKVVVDPSWYLREYADVREAVEGGRYHSAQEHFEKDGFSEGRLPFDGWTLLLPIR